MNSGRARLARTLALLLACPVLASGCWLFNDGGPAPQLQVEQSSLRRAEALDVQAMAPAARAEAPQPAAPAKPPAQQEDLTLQECRAAALTNNLDLRVELVNPAVAEEAAKEKGAVFEPSLFANAAYEKNAATTDSELGLGGVDTRSVGGGVTFPLRTGGTVTIGAAGSRTTTEGVPGSGRVYSVNPSVSLTQPLLSGGGESANTYAIRIARYQVQVIEAETKLAVMRVIADVDRAYWRLYAARRELQVRKSEYDLANEQLARAQRMLAAGATAQVEIVRAETGVADRLEAIIIADNAVRDREREFKHLINRPDLPVEGPTAIVPVTPPDTSHHELDLGKLIAAALDHRMELLEVELQLAQDASTVDLQRNQALPFLAVSYTYGINALGRTAGDALDMAFDRNSESHTLGLNLTVPLGNKAANARLRQALYRKWQTLATREQRVQQVRQDVAGALDALESDWRRIAAAQQRVTMAQRNVDAEIRQFQVGLRTSTDVLQAQADLADAQLAQITAETEYQISKVDLAFATGMLLGEAAVEWQPIVPPAN
jgi:outer membrane protein